MIFLKSQVIVKKMQNALSLYKKISFPLFLINGFGRIRRYISGGFQTEIRIKIKSGFVMNTVNVIHESISSGTYLYEQLIKSTSKYIEKVAGCSRWPCRFGKHRMINEFVKSQRAD